jgi:HlyD family secretion protein
MRPVKVGKKNGLAAEVIDGLAEGDTVVVHPSDKVTNGVEVIRR